MRKDIKQTSSTPPSWYTATVMSCTHEYDQSAEWHRFPGIGTQIEISRRDHPKLLTAHQIVYNSPVRMARSGVLFFVTLVKIVRAGEKGAGVSGWIGVLEQRVNFKKHGHRLRVRRRFGDTH
ncbi:hypothetical protein DFH09DRAFT_1098277 [Mycena vulgaris]|nr:hypothetical protein DFH09DRAFT_1098277 [Mycena vulgaris]